MLVALVCLLVKNGKRVVFLPNCHTVLNIGFGHYVTLAPLLYLGQLQGIQVYSTKTKG